jgi:hypothetical protein
MRVADRRFHVAPAARTGRGPWAKNDVFSRQRNGESNRMESPVNCIKASIVAALATLAVAPPAMAQGSAPAVSSPPAAVAPNLDPNQRICQKQEVTGSRLSTRRVCMTRSEWADRKLQDRQDVEKVQVQRGMIDITQ